ncbi:MULTISPECIES: ribosome small subunit-dependent GTPase A [Sporosarcina]|uniref:Small ribosomal subunit biogenesis GTPase RsgA n=1 Tax=Sporosarcina saromensis TaxID=359365 RepID=A0ABU4G610_9BACL|nr:ribosome small subunit-dependent GTPase A [Sporosarcina saromensis]MDW0111827.1 ribosome small subunit-dependent GTPase A [Sporosarcina saromensis]
MPKGQIRKAISGFYYVEIDGELIQCKGRGVFRNRGISPLVGDFVTIVTDGANDATITEVHERKNELVRPPVSNIDQALLVFSIVEPDFSLHLLDRFLVVIESYGIQPIICTTKKDIADNESLLQTNEALNYYQSIGYDIIQTFIEDATLFDVLQPFVTEKTSVLAGQSGVGKSTLLNTLIPELALKTGAISEALGRGKHTTRHVELIEVAGGLIADTPGFSSLDFDHIEKEELKDYFIEMASSAHACKFRGCMHMKEPGCAVKAKVESGEILRSRYDNYVQFLQEITDRKPRYS